MTQAIIILEAIKVLDSLWFVLKIIYLLSRCVVNIHSKVIQISWLYSCNTSSYIRSVYIQWHVVLLRCTDQIVNNQTLTQVLQLYVHVFFCLEVIRSWSKYANLWVMVMWFAWVIARMNDITHPFNYYSAILCKIIWSKNVLIDLSFCSNVPHINCTSCL